MIVHVASYLEEMGGSVDKRHYLRPLPGREGWAALCKKPKYNKKEQKVMAQRPTVVQFKEMMVKVKAIMADPEQKAQWAAKHANALREEKKHPHSPNAKGIPYIPARLYDYIRREVMHGQENQEKSEQ